MNIPLSFDDKSTQFIFRKSKVDQDGGGKGGVWNYETIVFIPSLEHIWTSKHSPYC